jgi:hypothetical protein
MRSTNPGAASLSILAAKTGMSFSSCAVALPRKHDGDGARRVARGVASVNE